MTDNTFDLNFDGVTDDFERMTEYRLVMNDFPEKEDESVSDFDWFCSSADNTDWP